MRRLILLITALWLFIPSMAAWGYDLLIVQSQRSPAYDEVLRGFRSVAKFTERIIIISDYNEVDLVRIAREESPIAIVTLGDKALATARKVRNTPIVALMSFNYRANNGHPAMTGIEVQAPADRYLAIFASIKVSRVGVISGSANSAAYVRQARKIAARSGIELVTREVKSSREVSGQLDSLAGAVDAIWMLPDSVTSSGEAADAHFMTSARHNIPVVTLSSAYLASGAAFALDIDRFDMGMQAGEMAVRLIHGNSVSDVPPEQPRKTSIRNNPSILRKLGISSNDSGFRTSGQLP